MFSRWKLALETSANFVVTRAEKRRWNTAPLSGAGFQREFPTSESWALWNYATEFSDKLITITTTAFTYCYISYLAGHELS